MFKVREFYYMTDVFLKVFLAYIKFLQVVPLYGISYAYICITDVMNWNMIGNILSKYIWLAETIYSADDGITFSEINKKWLDNDLSEGLDLSKRTFHKWRIAIEELFGRICSVIMKTSFL